MENLGKVLLYPFGKRTIPLLYAISSSNEYEVSALVVPEEWAEEGMDAGKIGNYPLIGIKMHTGFLSQLEFCDTVIFAESSYRMGKRVFENAEAAISNNKNVIFTYKWLTSEEQDELKKLASKGNSFLLFYTPEMKEETQLSCQSNKMGLLDGPPIVGLGEIQKTVGSERFLVRLQNAFNNKGYKTLLISDNNDLQLFDCNYCFPSILFDENVSPKNKIESVKEMIQTLIESEKPDIVFMSVPDSLLRYNDRIDKEYCLLPYYLSCSLIFDFFILSVTCGQYSEDYFRNLTNHIEQKYGFQVDIIIMNNIQINLTETTEMEDVVFDYLPQELAQEIFEKNNIYLGDNLLFEADEKSIQYITGMIENKFGIELGDDMIGQDR